MFDNVESLIGRGYRITIDAERYGRGYLVGLDAISSWYHNIMADLIDTATSPGDVDAINAFEILEEFSEKYEGFLYARADSIYEALCKLEERAKFHQNMDVLEIEEMLKKLEKVKKENNL